MTEDDQERMEGPTTEDDDQGVINVLRSIISERYPPGTIGYDYLDNAIEHIQKMRKELNALRRADTRLASWI